MAESDNITISKGDYGFRLNFTLYDSAGSARNMTGYTVSLKVWSEGVPGTLLVNKTCSPTDASLGTYYYTVGSTDFATEGRFAYEIEATKTGIIESAKSGWITIMESG